LGKNEQTDGFEASPPDEVEVVKWKVPLKIRSSVHNFEVRLGPPGGEKGYKAITGQDPSLIELCFWINNLLLPELTVYRGQTYYFKVNGGDSERQVHYHPFYITSSPLGGYGNKAESEKNIERIWAGVKNPYTYEATPTAYGSLCYYRSKEGEDKWREADTFKSYRNTLEVVCERGHRQIYGLLNWTVVEDTPPVVYYQSYTYEGLGWKINVLDAAQSSSPNSPPYLLTILSSLHSALKSMVTRTISFFGRNSILSIH